MRNSDADIANIEHISLGYQRIDTATRDAR